MLMRLIAYPVGYALMYAVTAKYIVFSWWPCDVLGFLERKP